MIQYRGPIPYNAAMITALLRAMTADMLATKRPQDFQRWPLLAVEKAGLIAELIANEKSRRTR